MADDHDDDGRARRLRPFTTQTWERMSLLFKALADPTHLRIIHSLIDGERSVGDVARAVQMSPSDVSHELNHLRLVRLVRSRRDGRIVYYRLDDEDIYTLFMRGLDHVSHE